MLLCLVVICTFHTGRRPASPLLHSADHPQFQALSKLTQAGAMFPEVSPTPIVYLPGGLLPSLLPPGVGPRKLLSSLSVDSNPASADGGRQEVSVRAEGEVRSVRRGSPGCLWPSMPCASCAVPVGKSGVPGHRLPRAA